MSKHLRVIGHNIHLSVGEQEWLAHMQAMFGCTEQEALEEIIKYKREMAFSYEHQGVHELARQLLKEIDEWDDEREQDFKQKEHKVNKTKIILPGQ